MNLKEIKEILELMDTHGLTEFELEKNGEKVKLSKSSSGTMIAAPQAFSGPALQSFAGQPLAITPGALAQPQASIEDPNLVIVRSPMVGTFYAAPAPDKPPYVQKGQEIKVDDVLCIIEAMKLMNEIKSEVAGKIVEVLVGNGEPVEFDQPLFKIQK